MKKLLNLLNVKNWMETFLMKTMVNKGIKHAVTVIAGLVMGAKVQSILTQYGIAVDVPHLQSELTVAFGAAAGWLINWATHVIYKDAPDVQAKVEAAKV